VNFSDTLWWMLVAALLVPAHAAAFRRGEAWLTALVCADVVALALVGIAAQSEARYAGYAQEDGVIEWATTFGFLAAATLSARAFRRDAPPFESVVRVGFVLFCVLVAGEEISWGQRLVGFQPPEVFLERNFQQELNLHNVLMDEQASGLGFELDSKHLVMAIAFVFGVLGPLLVRLRALHLRDVAPIAPPWVLAPLFVAVMAAEASYPVDLTGEGAEMLLAILFVIAAAFGKGSRTIVVSVVAVFVLASVTAPLLSRIVYGSDEQGIAKARAELELLAKDIHSSATPKLLKKSGIHKRVFTAMRDGYYVSLEAGAFATSSADEGRHKYFLDPWNNPYWVLVEKDEDRVVIYSFGPNRRRDTEMKKRNKPSGDDVMVVQTLHTAP
jgi:hypothetical protein